ncbi:MAG: electron transfer flavoprotein subunit alpha [Elusimicrobiota bacterium]|jgi:electron transfer flavoprotein alpha subunit|nr:electron transfer flavoprotein subunit alpha [Elusimicrobiota bacterium]
MINVLPNCIGCGKCVPVCPFGALSLVDKKAVCGPACTLCGACVSACPVKALQMPQRAAAGADLASYKGIWVFVEVINDKGVLKNRPVSLELLTKGRELANELGEKLCAVAVGANNSGLYAEISAYGADIIYSVEGPAYADYNTAAYANAVITLIKKYKPSAVLYPSTYIGRDLAPRIAAEIHVGLTADCTGLSIKNGNLVQTRPAFGGNIMADILCPNHRPQMATVRPNVMGRAAVSAGKTAQIVREVAPVPASAAKVRILKKEIDASAEVENIDEAQIVISGGRGLKTAENFRLINEIAAEFGGAVGASRAAIDAGWKPKNHQVGQSGVTVKPKLYMACGISGAVQHVVGMENSEVIIAINKDGSAPIFNVCKYGIVGDLHQILPKLLTLVRDSKK